MSKSCLFVYGAHSSVLCIGHYTSLFRQTNTLRGIVLQRVGMMAYPPSYCLTAAGDGRNSFVLRAIKLCVLAGRREKCKWRHASFNVWCNDERSAFSMSLRGRPPPGFSALPTLWHVYVFMLNVIFVPLRKYKTDLCCWNSARLHETESSWEANSRSASVASVLNQANHMCACLKQII